MASKPNFPTDQLMRVYDSNRSNAAKIKMIKLIMDHWANTYINFILKTNV